MQKYTFYRERLTLTSIIVKTVEKCEKKLRIYISYNDCIKSVVYIIIFARGYCYESRRGEYTTYII